MEVKQRRAQSEDRYSTPSYTRASYVDATTPKSTRGRPVSKKSESEGLKRRPSLNKQMRKKFESIIGASKDKNKLCDDVDLIDRIRSLPTQLKGTIFNIKVKISFY